MKTSTFCALGLASLALWGGILLPVLAQETVAANAEKQEPAQAVQTAGRGFQLGLRYTWVSLLDDERPTDGSDNYLGSINKLEVQQSEMPFPVLSYRWGPTFDVALSYDQVRAKTITIVDGHTDGTYDMQGPVLTGLFKLPTHTRFTPYAELGVAYYFGDFDHDPAWRHVGNDRLMVIDDAIGLPVALGCDVHLRKAWNAQLFCRYDFLEIKDHYYLNGNLKAVETIPLSNIGLGAGLSYAF